MPQDYTIFFRQLADALEVTEEGAAGSDLVPGPRALDSGALCRRTRCAFNDVHARCYSNPCVCISLEKEAWFVSTD